MEHVNVFVSQPVRRWGRMHYVFELSVRLCVRVVRMCLRARRRPSPTGLLFVDFYTVSQKRHYTLTSPNVNLFSKVFHQQIE